VVLTPPNLPCWRDIPLARLVSERFGLPAALENDANAAGLAEVLFGAGAAYRDIFYVTVSTGIGTGLIIDRKIYHGKNGVAGEGGHVTVDCRSPYVCGCGSRGCIEALASGPAMVRRTRVLLEQRHGAPSLLRTLAHRDLNRITPNMVAEAARRHDSLAREVLDETGFYLGVWLGSMVSLLDTRSNRDRRRRFADRETPVRIRSVPTVPDYTVNRKFVPGTSYRSCKAAQG